VQLSESAGGPPARTMTPTPHVCERPRHTGTCSSRPRPLPPAGTARATHADTAGGRQRLAVCHTQNLAVPTLTGCARIAATLRCRDAARAAAVITKWRHACQRRRCQRSGEVDG
jgi:hypothetical protein